MEVPRFFSIPNWLYPQRVISLLQAEKKQGSAFPSGVVWFLWLVDVLFDPRTVSRY